MQLWSPIFLPSHTATTSLRAAPKTSCHTAFKHPWCKTESTKQVLHRLTFPEQHTLCSLTWLGQSPQMWILLKAKIKPHLHLIWECEKLTYNIITKPSGSVPTPCRAQRTQKGFFQSFSLKQTIAAYEPYSYNGEEMHRPFFAHRMVPSLEWT